MRFYPPIYPGDSILHPGTFPGASLPDTRKSASFRTAFVHSSITGADVPALELDLETIKARARRARVAWVGNKLKSLFKALVYRFERGDQAEMEHYLAASESIADLEVRIRRYERMHSQGN